MAGIMPLSSYGGGSLRLLSIDHGDATIYSTLYILVQLMKRVNIGRYESGLPSLKPCDVFNLIGGVGLGG